MNEILLAIGLIAVAIANIISRYRMGRLARRVKILEDAKDDPDSAPSLAGPPPSEACRSLKQSSQNFCGTFL
jgi:hypothetical protein